MLEYNIQVPNEYLQFSYFLNVLADSGTIV